MAEEKTAYTIDECLKEDKTTAQLRAWSVSLEKLGQGLFWTIVILGLILSIVNGKDEYDDFSVTVFLTEFISWCIYAFIEYVVAKVLSLLIAALANITHNTRITAKLAEYTTRRAEGAIPAAPAASCTAAPAAAPTASAAAPAASSVSPAVETPDVAAPAASSAHPVPVRVYTGFDGKITCPTCGSKQDGKAYACTSCGQVFINHQPNIPFWCGACGHEGPYEGACPVCGSGMKLMN